ncbi:MAG: SMC-Scp complex subunit ScpB [Planctomycetota bacterium]
MNHSGFLPGGVHQRAHAIWRPYGVLNADHRVCDEPVSLDSTVPAAEDEEDEEVRQMRLEAVLLVAKTPLSTRKLAQLAHLADGTEARTLLRKLNDLYDRFGRAVRIQPVAGGWRMMTRQIYAPWLSRLGHLPSTVRLSSPMMETLAVVAYRGPVSRADIEAIRGVACGELLRQLMERDLIRIAGRSEDLGRPYLYDTTKQFLRLFGLPSSDALPAIDWDPVT